MQQSSERCRGAHSANRASRRGEQRAHRTAQRTALTVRFASLRRSDAALASPCSLGLWHVPIQWRSLRRVPGWTYPSVPIKKIKVEHQYLYPLLFQRMPMLRLEGHRLGETAVEGTGATTSKRTLTQRMVLRWHHLIAHEHLSLADAFEQIKFEFRVMIENFQKFLTQARVEAVDRHQKLSVAKVKRDALQ